jgi:glc operon protein GlcG
MHWASFSQGKTSRICDDNSGRSFMRNVLLTSLALSSILMAGPAGAQAPAPPPAYGDIINLEQAKKAADAAEAEMKKNNWTMAIAVVAPTGDLVYFRRLDNTQFGSTAIALHKAKAAAIFKRPTKSFEDRVAAGGAGLAALTLDGMIASEGGIPIVVGGKIVGAMGCSGGTAQQDGQACQAGVDALK